jgi:hypothetical protein
MDYSLEIDDNTARVGLRVARKGYVHYLREFTGGFMQGSRLVLSERGPFLAEILGGIVVPKGLPEYEQIKLKVSTWVVDTAHHTEE